MQNAIQRARDVRVRRDVVLDKLELLVARQMRNVVGMSGDEVVEANHCVPFPEESIAEVGSEKPTRAGDQDSHAAGRPMESYVKPRVCMRFGS